MISLKKIKAIVELEELKKIDKCILSDEQLEELQEHPLVKWFENLGASGCHKGCTWWDVLLVDGTFMDVYTR